MIKEFIQNLAKRIGVEPIALAEMIGVDKTTIVKWLNGGTPSIASIHKLAEKLCVPSLVVAFNMGLLNKNDLPGIDGFVEMKYGINLPPEAVTKINRIIAAANSKTR